MNFTANLAQSSIWSAAPALVGLSMVLLACSPPPLETPRALIGIWSTPAPRYAHRTFEVRPKAIIFRTGQYSAPNFHVLDRVESLPSNKPGLEAWRLYYREDDGAIAKLDLELRAKPKPTLQFANRIEVWTPVRKEEPKKESSEVKKNAE